MSKETEKSCSRCEVNFECSSDYGCWCNDVSLTAEQLSWIKENYDNCLCPSCLRIVSQEESTIT